MRKKERYNILDNFSNNGLPFPCFLFVLSEHYLFVKKQYFSEIYVCLETVYKRRQQGIDKINIKEN
jgi:hypothetical protein